MNFGNTLFIQNETISSDRVYKADKIIVGKDVNSSGIYGPVIFEKGEIKMYQKKLSLIIM